jgi:hypothetical protein
MVKCRPERTIIIENFVTLPDLAFASSSSSNLEKTNFSRFKRDSSVNTHAPTILSYKRVLSLKFEFNEPSVTTGSGSSPLFEKPEPHR